MWPFYIFVNESCDSIDHVFDFHWSLCLDAKTFSGVIAQLFPLDELMAHLHRPFPLLSVPTYLTISRCDHLVNGVPADQFPCHSNTDSGWLRRGRNHAGIMQEGKQDMVACRNTGDAEKVQACCFLMHSPWNCQAQMMWSHMVQHRLEGGTTRNRDCAGSMLKWRGCWRRKVIVGMWQVHASYWHVHTNYWHVNNVLLKQSTNSRGHGRGQQRCRGMCVDADCQVETKRKELSSMIAVDWGWITKSQCQKKSESLSSIRLTSAVTQVDRTMVYTRECEDYIRGLQYILMIPNVSKVCM